MANNSNKLSVYIPEDKKGKNLIKRLESLANERDRSINYLLVQAIERYLEEEEETKNK